MSKTRATIPDGQNTAEQIEVKDAQLIFTQVWNKLESDFGHENLRFSKELILLGGAPGSGKGTNTEFIRKMRDISSEPIVVSALLDTPELVNSDPYGQGWMIVVELSGEGGLEGLLTAANYKAYVLEEKGK